MTHKTKFIIGVSVGIVIAVGIAIHMHHKSKLAKLKMPGDKTGGAAGSSNLTEAEKTVVNKVEAASKAAEEKGANLSLWLYSDYAKNAGLTDAETALFKSSVVKHGDKWK